MSARDFAFWAVVLVGIIAVTTIGECFPLSASEPDGYVIEVTHLSVMGDPKTFYCKGFWELNSGDLVLTCGLEVPFTRVFARGQWLQLRTNGRVAIAPGGHR